MNDLDKLYMDLRDGVITQKQYDKAVGAYHNIPEQERGKR